MGNEKIQIGDRVLAKRVWGSVFTAHIIFIKRGLLGKKYYAEWIVDSDMSGTYQYAGILRSWNIILKY